MAIAKLTELSCSHWRAIMPKLEKLVASISMVSVLIVGAVIPAFANDEHQVGVSNMSVYFQASWYSSNNEGIGVAVTLGRDVMEEPEEIRKYFEDQFAGKYVSAKAFVVRKPELPHTVIVYSYGGIEDEKTYTAVNKSEGFHKYVSIFKGNQIKRVRERQSTAKEG